MFQGDSGGPLVTNGIMIGITSWGFACAVPRTPGAFSSIPVLRTYIDKILEENSYNTRDIKHK